MSRPTDRLRIVMLAESMTSGVGGIAIHASELAAALHKRGHQIELISIEQFIGTRLTWRWRPRKVPAPIGGLQAWQLPISWTPRRVLTGAQLERRWKPWLHRLISASGAQILHWHGIDADSCVTCPVPPGIAAVFTNHSSQFLERCAEDPAAAIAAFRHAHQIIAPSCELAQATRAGGFPADAIHRIPNGVDVDRFRPDLAARRHWREKHGIAAADVVSVIARRLVPKNGILHLARAAASLEQSFDRRTVLCFAGDGAGGHGSYESEVRAICASLGKRVDVRWLGWVPSAEMPSVLAGSDIALLPSLTEATSLSGLEAMASGCVLLGTRTGGIPELITDDVNGVLVPPGDSRALEYAWRDLIANANRRKRLASAARIRVEQEFAWSAVARQTERVYRVAMEGLAATTSRHAHAAV